MTEYQDRMAVKYEQRAERIISSVTEEDITKASQQQMVIGVATCTDKTRLIRGQATCNQHIILEAIKAACEDD